MGVIQITPVALRIVLASGERPLDIVDDSLGDRQAEMQAVPPMASFAVISEGMLKSMKGASWRRAIAPMRVLHSSRRAAVAEPGVGWAAIWAGT